MSRPVVKFDRSQTTAVGLWVSMILIGWVASAEPQTTGLSNATAQAVSPTPSSLRSGAATHWAFQLPQTPRLPAVGNVGWPKTPMDVFILAKLEKHGLPPSPVADKRTLIRRATFDLHGLPPSPHEVRLFLDDPSPEAFAKVVDRLLASPRYGERWGRYWLDVARYADTKGYVYGDREEARFVHSSAYRDWVIRAFNDDLPYDEFLRLQLAADQMRPPSHPDLAALGFLTLGRRFLGVVHDIIDDRIDVVMRGTQALTVGCARCHDHKFDPIPTQDYYALYGIFAGCTEKLVPIAATKGSATTPPEFAKGLRERIDKYNETFRKRRDEFSTRFRDKVTDYLIAVLDVKKLPTEEHYEIRGANDLNPTVVRSWENYLLQTKHGFHPVFGLWNALDPLPAVDLARQTESVVTRLAKPEDPSRRANPLVLQAFAETPPNSMREVAERYGRLFSRVHRQWQEAVQTSLTNKAALPAGLPDPWLEELRQVLYGPNAPVNIPPLAATDLEWYFDEKTRVELVKLNSEIERWIIKSTGATPHAVILEDRASPKNARVFIRGNPANKGEEVPRRFLQALSKTQAKAFEIGSGRLELARAIATRENPLTARVMANRIWQHHFGAGLVRTPSDFGARAEAPSHPELLDWLACHFMESGWSMKSLHRLMMLSSVYQQTSDPESFPRGNDRDESMPGRDAFHRVRSSFSALSSSDALGRSSIPFPSPWPSPQGEYLFSGVRPSPGAAISARFGTIEGFNNASGFSVSAPGDGRTPPNAYQGEGSRFAKARRLDPENRLLWKMNRTRLDFESLRDALNEVSGETDAAMGGPSFELFKPPFNPRRSVYGFIDRQFLPGVLRMFDFANPDMHSPQRSDTTVPQQALFFMNGPFVAERARALLNRPEIRSFTEADARIEELYEMILQRPPTPHEIELGKNFLEAASLEPPYRPPPLPPAVWFFGYGEIDPKLKQLKQFSALPYFTGQAWQGGAQWPDEKLGWVRLTADGGHAGNDRQHAAIRRWVAPRDATISINGTLKHDAEKGDGVEGYVVSSRTGVLGHWAVHHSKADTKIETIEVMRGDTIDFAVDARGSIENDVFLWAPIIKVVGSENGTNAEATAKEWNAQKEFSGPPAKPPQPLNPWEQYGQVLLLSNEFLFVD